MIEIAQGWVYHARKGLIKNAFKYPIFYLRFALDTEKDVHKYLRQRFPFLKIDPKLYLLGSDKTSLDFAAREFLKINFNSDPEEICLQTMPKMFGYGFNPIHFWFCYESKKLTAVLCEVNNTFGERHFYWIDQAAAIQNKDFISSCKEFHVSPFFPVNGNYKFKFDIERDRYRIDINYYNESNELQLSTWVSGCYQPLSNIRPFNLLLKYGWLSALVMIRIHYQAFKLWLKGAKFYKLPKNRKSVITKWKR
jgi:DUF1365 family protein